MPVSDEALLRTAVDHHQRGQLDQAKAIYQQILQSNENDANALNLLGMVHHAQGRQQQAEVLIRHAIELAPNIAGFQTNLGNVLLAQRRLAEADAAYARAIELQPDYAEAYNNRGVTLMAQGKIRESFPLLARAIELRHDYPSARNNLGNALRARGMYREAARCYLDAITQNPSLIDAHANLAITLLAMNRADEAIERCRTTLSLQPDHAGARMTLGCALESTGRKDGAVAVYEEALRQSPQDQDLRFHLAALTGREKFVAAPPRYITSLFDNYADVFDLHLVQALQYRAPQVVVDAARAAGAGTSLDVIDLGCGTGLCGPLLRPIAKTLTGVDLSGGMIDRARERNVYDELFVEDLIGFLRVRFARFDLAVAADVLVYFGDLSSPLMAIAQSLRPGAIIVFTCEKQSDNGFVLNPNRRYAHSIQYVRDALKQASLIEVSIQEEVLRKQSNAEMKAIVVVAKRG